MCWKELILVVLVTMELVGQHLADTYQRFIEEISVFGKLKS